MHAKIVHLSDLHFKNDAENRKRIEYLKTDLQRLEAEGGVFTAFTGDLVQSGDRSEDYDVLFDILIAPLSEMAHEVLVIPGNHDIQRSVANHDFIERHLEDRTSSYLFQKSSEMVQPNFHEVGDPLEHYRTIEEVLGPYDHHTYYGYSRTRGGLSFVGMNTTWLSRERPVGGTDRGKLRLEPYVLDKLSEKLPSETTKIALLHHPLDWLEETTRDAVSKLLMNRFDLVLYGHVHATDLTNLAQIGAGCIFMQSPPLRSGWSKGSNGYTVIQANLEHKKFEIEYRAYSETRRKFIPGEDFAPNGILRPREEDEIFYSTKPSGETLMLRFSESETFDYTAWYRANIRAKSKITSNFVSPKARKVSLDQDDTWLEPALPVTQLAKSSFRDQYYIAPLDSGLTTAAFLTFKEIADDFDSLRKIPAFFDAKEQKINKASILREIGRTCLVNYSHAEVEALVNLGGVCVIVDGLSLANVEQFNLFREVAGKFFSKVRFLYFLTTEQRGAPTVGSAIPNLNSETDEVYEFAQMYVADIREMVSLRSSEYSGYPIDSVVSQVVESFRQMDEPVYASSVAVVVETLNQDPEFKPINKARLLERYVECLLGRFDLEDVREGTFASSDKIDLLSFAARRMLEEDVQGIAEKAWGDLCEDYQRTYLIDLPNHLLDEFIEKGILTIFRGQVTFRGDYLFSFFVARQMKADPKFSEELTTGESLFKYHKEVAFYGDLEGTETRGVLGSIYTTLDSLQAILNENYSDAGVDLAAEWQATCIEQNGISSQTEAFENAADNLGRAGATPEQADRFDNSQLSEIVRRRGVTKRMAVMEAEAKLLVALRLYAALLKNALQVPAAEKLKHLSKLFESAETWVGFLCAYRGEITSNPVVMIGGIRITNPTALIDSDRSASEFKYNAPNSMSRVLAEALKNPQLATALRKVLPELQPMSALFARDALLGLPSGENREAYLSSLTNEKDINLATASLRTLRGRYLASGRNKAQREHIEAVVEQLSRIGSPVGSINFDKLKRARMIRDMKEKANSLHKEVR